MRIVHYVNQFYAGLGGEDAADIGPRLLDGTVGPGRLLARAWPQCGPAKAGISTGAATVDAAEAPAGGA